MEDTYDYVVIGSGVGGLCTAALLASTGYRVCVLERHVVPGGYEHSFTKGGYTFCAQLHYLWNCGRDDEFGLLLRYLGLQDKVTFSMLDADGFDRLNFPSFKYDIVNGFDRNIELISKKFPEHRASITRYFKLITRLNREMLRLPIGFDAWSLARHALSYPNVLRYRNWTTEDLFDSLRLPPEVRSILAGQSGDLLLPPGRASLLVQAALACGYDSGAYVPVKGYQHLFSSLTGFIEKQRSCKILLGHWVTSLQHTGGRVTAATTRKGKVIRGRHFLYNGDPAMLRGLLGTALPGWFEKRLHYEFSPSSFTIYLGLKGIDLTRHGFGNWNVWHYAHDSISRCYEDQLDHGMMDNPSMFLSTPTLHQKGAPMTPPDCHQLVVCTPCTYEYFAKVKAESRTAYLAEKARVTEQILRQIERHYIPSIRKHIELMVAGTPSTNQRFTMSPMGNAYGANLTPRQINIGKIDYHSPWKNLYLVGATAGVPSFAGGVHFAILMFQHLTGLQLGSTAPIAPRIGKYRDGVPLPNLDQSQPLVKVP